MKIVIITSSRHKAYNLEDALKFIEINELKHIYVRYSDSEDLLTKTKPISKILENFF